MRKLYQRAEKGIRQGGQERPERVYFLYFHQWIC